MNLFKKLLLGLATILKTHCKYGKMTLLYKNSLKPFSSTGLWVHSAVVQNTNSQLQNENG